jgi:very-short-patch-repair endonuclease
VERKWRADFAHVESRTLLEIEGGIYIQGRHNRPQGFAADAEKYLEAALAGWRVLRLTEPQITAPMIERIIRFVLNAIDPTRFTETQASLPHQHARDCV